MNSSARLLATLVTGTLLFTGCGDQKSAATTTDPKAPTASTDHSAMHHGPATADMKGLMNTMMTNMEGAKPAGNTDRDFALMMMAHHKGAVEMSALELKEGTDATLRAMAEKISADQQQEILVLQEAATRLDAAPANYKPTDPADPFTRQLKASMDGMMLNLGEPSGSVDQDYAALMIPHHQSAVAMAQAELTHGQDSKLKQLAQQIISAQEQEIKQFKVWQVKHAGQIKPGAALYECPMGDGGRSNAPGKCPKCGMDLEKKA
ncbi:DUF305 domain-containing protein [Hymenobacter chitinivorans]|uniref:Uncharacterized protein (DUF305 family) n=1 Tax=Hymenobacter chitinivorans DSM 11115 TaxID=1121954 RepID=A0A2M9BNI6_9BACT|nr:DUF305 domain-containing protein [Hymenobacter chitinivorans]PJJ59509.1 uncharacterized protein (DUF305 family) [Hymenobacter chitinivorans DSM 11115]